MHAIGVRKHVCAQQHVVSDCACMHGVVEAPSTQLGLAKNRCEVVLGLLEFGKTVANKIQSSLKACGRDDGEIVEMCVVLGIVPVLGAHQ